MLDCPRTAGMPSKDLIGAIMTRRPPSGTFYSPAACYRTLTRVLLMQDYLDRYPTFAPDSRVRYPEPEVWNWTRWHRRAVLAGVVLALLGALSIMLLSARSAAPRPDGDGSDQ